MPSNRWSRLTLIYIISTYCSKPDESIILSGRRKLREKRIDRSNEATWETDIGQGIHRVFGTPESTFTLCHKVRERRISELYNCLFHRKSKHWWTVGDICVLLALPEDHVCFCWLPYDNIKMSPSISDRINNSESGIHGSVHDPLYGKGYHQNIKASMSV
jgi:hypothetical protein